jgi:hypothetical protein
MDSVEVIPAPPRRRWREFRHRFLPVLVFACTVVLIGRLWSTHVIPASLNGAAEPPAHALQIDFSGTVTNLLAERLVSAERGI